MAAVATLGFGRALAISARAAAGFGETRANRSPTLNVALDLSRYLWPTVAVADIILLAGWAWGAVAIFGTLLLLGPLLVVVPVFLTRRPTATLWFLILAAAATWVAMLTLH